MATRIIPIAPIGTSSAFSEPPNEAMIASTKSPTTTTMPIRIASRKRKYGRPSAFDRAKTPPICGRPEITPSRKTPRKRAWK